MTTRQLTAFTADCKETGRAVAAVVPRCLPLSGDLGICPRPFGTQRPAWAASASLHASLLCEAAHANRSLLVSRNEVERGTVLARPRSHCRFLLPDAGTHLHFLDQARSLVILNTGLAPLLPPPIFAGSPGITGAQRRYYARSRRDGGLSDRRREPWKTDNGFPWNLVFVSAGVILMLPVLVPLVVGGAFALTAYSIVSSIYRSIRKHISPPSRYPYRAERQLQIPTAQEFFTQPTAWFGNSFFGALLARVVNFAFSEAGAAVEAAETVRHDTIHFLDTRAKPQVDRLLGTQVSYGPPTSTAINAININGISRNQIRIAFPAFTTSRIAPAASVNVVARWKDGRGSDSGVEIRKVSFIFPDGSERIIDMRQLVTEGNDRPSVFEGEYREIKE